LVICIHYCMHIHYLLWNNHILLNIYRIANGASGFGIWWGKVQASMVATEERWRQSSSGVSALLQSKPEVALEKGPKLRCRHGVQKG
jgi:hypothetical protein